MAYYRLEKPTNSCRCGEKAAVLKVRECGTWRLYCWKCWGRLMRRAFPEYVH